MTGNALADCLGSTFDDLPPLIRNAHQGHIRLEGIAEVTRGAGLGGLLASMLGMPAANAACPMTVAGEHRAEAMLWSRDFNGRKMQSVFRRDGLNLVERMGPIRLRLRPEVRAARLHYRLEGAHFGPLPLPNILMPRLTAWEGEADGLYDFEVDIGIPFLGRLIRYRGRLRLVSSG